MKYLVLSAVFWIAAGSCGCQRAADVAVVADSIYKIDPAPLLPADERLGPRAASLGEGRSYWSGTAVAGKYAYQINQLGAGFDADLEFRDDTEWRIGEVNLETLGVEQLPAPPVAAPMVERAQAGFSWGGVVGERGLILDVQNDDGRQFYFWDGEWVSVSPPEFLDGGVVAGHSATRMIVANGRPFSGGTLDKLYFGGTQGWTEVGLPANAALGAWDETGLAVVYPRSGTLCVGVIEETSLQLNEQHCGDVGDSVPRSAVNGTTDHFITIVDNGNRTVAMEFVAGGWRPITEIQEAFNLLSVPWAPGSDALFLRYDDPNGYTGLLSVKPDELSIVAAAEIPQLRCIEAGCERSVDPSCPCASRSLSAPFGHQIANKTMVHGLIDAVNGRRNFHVQVTPFGEESPLTACAQDPELSCETERCDPASTTCGGLLGGFFRPPGGDPVADLSTVEVGVDILGEVGLDALTYEFEPPADDEEFRFAETSTGLTITGTPGGLIGLTLSSTGINPPAVVETAQLRLPAAGRNLQVDFDLQRGVSLGNVVEATVAPDGGAMFLGPVVPRLVRETMNGVEVSDIDFANEVVFAPGSRFALANSGATTVSGLDVGSATRAGFYGCPTCRFGGETWTRWVVFSPDGQCASVPLTTPVNEVASGVAVLCWDSGQLEEKFVVNQDTKNSWFSRNHEWFAHAGVNSQLTLYEVATGASFPVSGSLDAGFGLMGIGPSTLLFNVGFMLYSTVVNAGPAYATSLVDPSAAAHAVRGDDQWSFFTRSNGMGSQELVAYEFATGATTPISLMPAHNSDTYIRGSQTRQIDANFMWLVTSSGDDVVIDMNNFAALSGSPTTFVNFRVAEAGLLLDPNCANDCPFELFDTLQTAWRDIPRPSGIPAIGRELDSVGVLATNDTELYIGEFDAIGNVVNQRLVSRQDGGVGVRIVGEAFDQLGAPCVLYTLGGQTICTW